MLAACAPQSAQLQKGSMAAGPAIRVVAEPVSEGPTPGTGRFRFAGGLVLTSPDTSRLHGLSDLEITTDGRLVAISDDGDLVTGRIVLDPAGRLAGVTRTTLTPLTDLAGKPLGGDKARSDAEGLAIFPNGDRMVSFERDHRIWLYPAKGGGPRTVPSPNAPFPDNLGMEALALDPMAGPGAYLVGREDTRETWVCRLASGCVPGVRPGNDSMGMLVAARPLPGGRWAFLLRDFNVASGATIRILITDATGRTLDLHTIIRPATVDNFEGVTALPRADGSVRFYLISDDNFSAAQRTLLLAFDWTPRK
jgi:hypothetical protein